MTHDQIDKAMELADEIAQTYYNRGNCPEHYDAELCEEACAALHDYLLSTCKDSLKVAEKPVDLYEARFKRLVAMEASLAPEDRIAYYVRNPHELDRLIKLDGLAKDAT